MRFLISFGFLFLSGALAEAAPTFFPALSGDGAAPVLTVYSSLDEPWRDR